MKDGKITTSEYFQEWAKAKTTVLDKSDSMFDGIEAGLLKVTTSVGTTAQIWSGFVESAFSSVEKWIETLVTTGKGKFSDLLKSLESDLLKASFKATEKNIITALFGSGAAGGTGKQEHL